jgi:nucleoside-diphosphate-sugar epimerase
MAKYLVTGCAGFIGARVCKELLEAGHAVVGVDNLNESYNVALKRYRLIDLTLHQNFFYRRADITSTNEMKLLFKKSRFSGVINLAARAGVRDSLANPAEYFKTNVFGTQVLMDFCRAYNVPKFVLASTSSVYGNNFPPFSELDQADRPLSPYAASKKAAEVLAHSYHHLYDLDVAVLRFFTVYGEASRPDMAIYKFIHDIYFGHPITVYGDGTQLRDFTYVGDIARGVVAALELNGYEVLNLGGSRPVELKTVISLIEKYTGNKAEINYEPRHRADAEVTLATILKAERLLAWKPEIGIEEGIARSVSWYEKAATAVNLL